MSPPEYYRDVIVPTYTEYLSDRANIRRAMLAAMVTYHFADYLAVARGDKNTRKVDAELIAACPAFEKIKAVCLASKHCVSDQTGLAAADLRRGRGAAFSDGTYFSDGSTFAGTPNSVVAGGTLGRVDLHHALKTAVAEIQRRVGAAVGA